MKTVRIQKQITIGDFTFDIFLDVESEMATTVQVKKGNEIIGNFYELTATDVDNLDRGFELTYSEIKNLEELKNKEEA